MRRINPPSWPYARAWTRPRATPSALCARSPAPQAHAELPRSLRHRPRAPRRLPSPSTPRCRRHTPPRSCAPPAVFPAQPPRHDSSRVRRSSIRKIHTPAARLGSVRRRWRKKVRTYRLFHAVVQDAIDFFHRRPLQLPPKHAFDRLQMLRFPSSEQSDRHVRLVKHPSHRKMDDALAVLFPSELVESRHSFEVLRVSRLLEFRIHTANIIGRKLCVGAHTSAEQPPA